MKTGKRWTKKPPLGTPIDFTHPWTYQMAAFWAFNENFGLPIELISRQRAYTSSHFSWAQDRMAGAFNGTTTQLTYPGNLIPAVGPAMTIVGRSSINALSTGTLIERRNANSTWAVYFSSSNPAVIQFRGGSSNTRNAITLPIGTNTNPEFSFGQFISWGFIDNGLPATSIHNNLAFLNGISVPNAGAGAGAPVSNNNDICIGAYDNGTNFFLNGEIDYIVVWNGQIATSIVQTIGVYPDAIWQVFKPRFKSRIYQRTSVTVLVPSFPHHQSIGGGLIVGNSNMVGV